MGCAPKFVKGASSPHGIGHGQFKEPGDGEAHERHDGVLQSGTQCHKPWPLYHLGKIL